MNYEIITRKCYFFLFIEPADISVCIYEFSFASFLLHLPFCAIYGSHFVHLKQKHMRALGLKKTQMMVIGVIGLNVNCSNKRGQKECC